MGECNQSRRRLLIGGSLGLATAAITQKASANETPRFDKVYDIIVVGSGFAGLAAALEAREQGASVLLIEKMPVYGGNSAINERK